MKAAAETTKTTTTQETKATETTVVRGRSKAGQFLADANVVLRSIERKYPDAQDQRAVVGILQSLLTNA